MPCKALHFRQGERSKCCTKEECPRWTSAHPGRKCRALIMLLFWQMAGNGFSAVIFAVCVILFMAWVCGWKIDLVIIEYRSSNRHDQHPVNPHEIEKHKTNSWTTLSAEHLVIYGCCNLTKHLLYTP